MYISYLCILKIVNSLPLEKNLSNTAQLQWANLRLEKANVFEISIERRKDKLGISMFLSQVTECSTNHYYHQQKIYVYTQIYNNLGLPAVVLFWFIPNS